MKLWEQFASVMATSVVHNMFKYPVVLQDWLRYREAEDTQGTVVIRLYRNKIGFLKINLINCRCLVHLFISPFSFVPFLVPFFLSSIHLCIIPSSIFSLPSLQPQILPFIVFHSYPFILSYISSSDKILPPPPPGKILIYFHFL